MNGSTGAILDLNMPAFSTDNEARILILVLCTWALLEHWRARGVTATQIGQLRRRWGTSIAITGISLAYIAGLFEERSLVPWVSRIFVFTGLMILAQGYRIDRKADSDARSG